MPLEVLALVALTGFGAYIRAHGFTAYDLWFDDAWASLSARVGLSTAVHMVLTAPGYSLAMRSWLRLDPTTTWWAQTPAFVLSVLATPAVYGLVRWLRSPRWVAFGAAVVITMSPVAVQYATRVKEYPFDLLAACVLLALVERLRRAPSAGRLVALAVASVLAFLVSAGSAPVIAGVWGCAIVATWPTRRLRTSLLVAIGGIGAGAILVWAAFLRSLPAVLNTNWRRRGFLLDTRSLPRVERSTSIMFGGFVHAVLAIPVPVSFYRGGTGFHDLPVALVGAIVVLGAVAVPVVTTVRRRAASPALAASLTLLVALVAALAGKVPFGDGRTDEVLYPAFLVCLAAVVEPVAAFVRRNAAAAGTRVTAIALGLALVAGSVAFGASHQGVYPTISLRGVWTRLHPLVRSGDVVFVDTFNSFTWCYYELTPCHVKIGGTPLWPQGFEPRPNKRHGHGVPVVFIATHYGIPLPEFTTAQSHASRIWYVGYTFGTFDVGASPTRYNVPVATYFTGLLRRDGWHAVPQRPGGPRTVVFGVHAYAQLYVR